MLQIVPIPAFQDNYIWLLQRHGHAVVVDPGDAAPVIQFLQHHQLHLDAVLITHHHSDHIGGVEHLLSIHTATVYAPENEQYSFQHVQVNASSQIQLDNLDLNFQVIEVPGHTLGHVAYYGANFLFCGDTLFGAGCGRLFEGTPEQMYQSLQKLSALPGATQVYCTHEYTERNIQFARTLEPSNQDLIQRAELTRKLRLNQQPTLPSTIALEHATNPFLRCDNREIKAASATNSNDPVEVFAAIRNMRNHF
jgi:hydroxyacylglutathione hydrolase